METLPWLGWLSTTDQESFLDSFLSTSQACHATGGYGPLEKLLTSWKASAQIVHDPELAAYLNADRGRGEEVSLTGPPSERVGAGTNYSSHYTTKTRRLGCNSTFSKGCNRQHPLQGEPGRGTFDGKNHQRWQIDVGSGSKVWYFVINVETGKGQKRRSGKVIIDQVLPGYPKETEKNHSGKRRPGRN